MKARPAEPTLQSSYRTSFADIILSVAMIVLVLFSLKL